MKSIIGKVQVMYKGDLYQLEVNGSQLLSAQDERGFEVFNPFLLFRLEYLWENGLIQF